MMFNFFRKKPNEYVKTLKAAEKAKQYARSIIVKGSTQLENNKLNQEHFDHLRKGVEGSTFSKLEGLGIKDIIDIETERRIQNHENPVLATYNSIISVTSKYSLGNCHELAVQALDYILRYAPEINAEVYTIEGGDHVFLVLNRDPYSKAEDPSNWGDNAVICDPWADEAYPAKDCSTRLKNFYIDKNKNQNKIEDYNPNKHFLMPSGYFNTTIIRSESLNLT